MSPIKSIQRGSVTATSGSSGTITVSAVDPAKAILEVCYKNGWAVGGYGNYSQAPGATLTNGTTITWYGGVAGGTETQAILYWQLVEYA